MQVKLVNARGEAKLLPLEMAVQGYPAQLDIPGIEIAGKHGEVVDRTMMRVRPRDVTVSGHISGLDRDHADRLRNEIVGFAYGANPICIYRHADAETYVVGDLVSVDHAYKVGHHGGRLFTLALQFRVSNPFHYSVAFTQETFGGGTVTVVNDGIAVNPVVWLEGSAVNPKLYNRTTGQTLQFLGTLAAGEIVAVDCERVRAHKVPNGTVDGFVYPAQVSGDFEGPSVVGQMADEWLVHSWTLAPGTNIVEATNKFHLSYRARWL